MTCHVAPPAIVVFAADVLSAQTRDAVAARFGSPQSEIFLLPERLNLSATYSPAGNLCAFHIETREHSDRVTASLTDSRYWTDSEHITRLIADRLPPGTRSGKVNTSVADLRPGEHMRVESDDAVEFTRIQRSRRLLNSTKNPVADRLVKIVLSREECRRDAD